MRIGEMEEKETIIMEQMGIGKKEKWIISSNREVIIETHKMMDKINKDLTITQGDNNSKDKIWE